MGRTPVNSAKRSVSSESAGVPDDPALNRSTSSNELYRCDLDGIKCHTDHHELAVRPQTVDQLRHRFRTRSCRQNYLRAAQLLQFLSGVGRFAVDVHARSEFLCECRVFGSAPDRRDLITKLVRELNSEMTQTADTLHRNQVAGQRAAVPQRIVRGNSGAEQRRGVTSLRLSGIVTSASTGATMYC